MILPPPRPVAPRAFYLDGGEGRINGRAIGPEPACARGRGPQPVLLIGPAQISSRFFVPLLHALGDDGVALSRGLPGFGESTPPDTAPPDVVPYVDALAHAIRVLAPEQTGGAGLHVLGLHAGAVLAVDLAIRYPDLIGRLALAAAPLFASDAERRVALASLAGKWEAVADGSHLHGQWNYWVTNRDPDLPLDQAISCYAQVVQAGARANWVLPACLRFPLRTGAQRVRCPTALLDIRDPLTPNNLALQALIAGSRRTGPLDLSIYSVVARPESFASALREVFDD